MRLHSTGLAALIILVLASSAMALDPMTTAIIKGWTKVCCEKYGVDPAFALAVAHIESRKGDQEFRVGRLGRSGKYYGPFGLNRCFLNRWPIDDLCTNIEVGVRALRGNPQRVLKRYNSAYEPSYAKAVFAARREYGRTYDRR